MSNDIFLAQEMQEQQHASALNLSERRGMVLHFLYTLEMNDYELSISDLIYIYSVGFNFIIDQDDEGLIPVVYIKENHDSIDEEISKFLRNWSLNRLSIIVQIILRYAIWELKIKKSDAALVINEAIELAHGYAEPDSYRLVHGILDAWSKANNSL